MGRIFLAILAGLALFGAAVYWLDLYDPNTSTPVTPEKTVVAAPEEKLGDFLYAAHPFPPYRIPERGTADPIEVSAVMNPLDQEKVPGVAQGQILFIGIPVEDTVAAAVGSAAFLTEPYWCAEIRMGSNPMPKFYRRLYEGDTVEATQLLGMIDPAKAILDVMEKTAKITSAEADVGAAVAAENEGISRWRRAKILRDKGALAEEEYTGAVLTMEKLKFEKMSKEAALLVAKNDKVKSETILGDHQIKSRSPHHRITIKSIANGAGEYIKQLEPVVMTVQSLERLQAEGLVDESSFKRLKERKNRDITATIVPSILEDPQYEIPAHNAAVTAVAVAKNMRIVSGSDDRTVCVWSPQLLAPLRRFELDSEVKALACTPVGAEKNLCLAGCKDGSLHLLDLDDPDPKKWDVVIKKTQGHGQSTEITSLAFSADGKYFATGALDGSIRLWTTWREKDGKDEYATELYPFEPEYGVAQNHGGNAVTSLHFTPQCRLISAGRDNTLRVWKLKEKGAVAEGQPLPFREGHVGQLGVSHDGKWMLFDPGNQGRMLKWLSVEDHKPVHTLSEPAGANAFDILAKFSPDDSLVLTAGAADGVLQLWRAPDFESRGFEVRQFGTRDRQPVACAAFSPDAGKGGANSFAVSGSGGKIFIWAIPTPAEVRDHRVERVPIRLGADNLEYGTRQGRLQIHVANPPTAQYPNGRFEAGRPVTIVID